jgi:hypothetical protein
MPVGPRPIARLGSAAGKRFVDLVGLRGEEQRAFPDTVAVWDACWDTLDAESHSRVAQPRPWRGAEIPLRIGGVPDDARRVRVRVVTLGGLAAEAEALLERKR